MLSDTKYIICYLTGDITAIIDIYVRGLMGSGRKSKQLAPDCPLINTILQLKIAKCIRELTDIKEFYDGWIFRTEVVHLIDVKYNTLHDFLEKLEREGVIMYLGNKVKPEYQGGVFKITDKGKRRIEEELKELLTTL